MRKIYLLFTLILFSFVGKISAQTIPPYSFTRMVADKAKNMIIFSSFQNGIDFTDSTIGIGYYWDTWPRQFIAKSDSEMNLLWHRSLGHWSPGKFRDAQLASDNHGCTYFACLFASTIYIDDTVMITAEGRLDSARLALMKFDAEGRLLWYRKSPLLVITNSRVGLGVDSSSNVFVSYNFSRAVTFGSDTLRESLTDSGTYVAKFDSSGNEQWLAGFSGYKQNNDFCVSRSGVAHIAGTASSVQGIGPFVFTIPDGPVPSLSVCNAMGVPYWQANCSGRKNGHKAVGVGPNECPVVAGIFYHSLGFSSLPSFSTSDSSAFIVSYNTDGTERWAKQAHGIDFFDLGVTSSNCVFLVGDVSNPVVRVDTTHVSIPGSEGAIVRLDSSGNYVCNFKYSNFFVESSCIGPSDEFIICGRAALENWFYNSFWNPIFAGDTMTPASDACIYILSIGANCELRKIDSLSNWYTPTEKVVDHSTRSKMLFFPNPVGGTLNIKIEAQVSSDGTLVIRDIAGRLLHSQPVRSRKVEVDVSALPPGLYTLEYLSGTEMVVEKFIKR
ncbi:MAG: T9SS type A sorting domain-containing protein [Taibaiella sp.]|nr:T9SS type A sorting domain-containing protein [Taibaiella sp.]